MQENSCDRRDIYLRSRVKNVLGFFFITFGLIASRPGRTDTALRLSLGFQE